MSEKLKQLQFQLARLNFYDFCQLIEPDFYKPNRTHLKTICETLNDFYYNRLIRPDGKPYTKLMLRVPPQHGKSRTLVNFTKWCLGKNQNERIITGSYGDTQASDFSRYTRDGISEVKNTLEQLVFSDIFPDCKIQQGNASFQKWALEGQHFNYLGVGCGGAVTGKGATLRIVDDLIKDAEIANNSGALDKIWTWFSGTFSSRNSAQEGQLKEIYCGTLWCKKDPQMILETSEPNQWYKIEMAVINELNNEMLCNEIMNYESYISLKNRMLLSTSTASIFWANYHCKTIDVEGRLYSKFKTYPLDTDLKGLPIYNYTDTADEGTDYLCSVSYVEKGTLKYVIDVYYSNDKMEVTDKELAQRFKNIGVNYANFESNNGGKGFARAVEILTQQLGNRKTAFSWFHQSGNKISRISTNASTVLNTVVFSEDWHIKYPEFYRDLTGYILGGKPADASDVVTGMVEKQIKTKSSFSF